MSRREGGEPEPGRRVGLSSAPPRDGARPDQARPMGMGGRMGMGEGAEIGGGLTATLRNLRTFESLKESAYRLYFASLLGQMFAMNMQLMARSLLVYRLTGSATALGVISLAQSVPMLFFSLFGGVMADRVPKKYVLGVSQAASMVLAFLVALALWSGILSEENPSSWWLLVAYALASGAVMGSSMPARQAIIPELVGTERVMNAVSLGQMGQNVLRILGPALAGFFVDWFGFAAIYFAMTAMYGFSLVFALLLPVKGTMSLRGRGMLGDVVQGFRYVRRDGTITMLLGLTLVMVFLSMPYMTLLPIFTEDILNVGATGIGLLLSVSGIGAIATSLVLASLPNKRRGLLFLVGSGFLGLALSAFSFSAIWWLSLVLIGLVGVGQTFRQALSQTLLQSYSVGAYRGRVMSIYMMEWGLTSFVTFFAAVMSDVIGVQWSVGGLAMILVVLSLLFIVFVPRMRRLD